MVRGLDFGATRPGSSPGREHCVAFLTKTLLSHGASLHPDVCGNWVPANCWGKPNKLRSRNTPPE